MPEPQWIKVFKRSKAWATKNIWINSHIRSYVKTNRHRFMYLLIAGNWVYSWPWHYQIFRCHYDKFVNRINCWLLLYQSRKSLFCKSNLMSKNIQYYQHNEDNQSFRKVHVLMLTKLIFWWHICSGVQIAYFNHVVKFLKVESRLRLEHITKVEGTSCVCSVPSSLISIQSLWKSSTRGDVFPLEDTELWI